MRVALLLAMVVGCSAANPNFAMGQTPDGDPVGDVDGGRLDGDKVVDQDGDAGHVEDHDAGGDAARAPAPDLSPLPDLTPSMCPQQAQCTPGAQRFTADGCEVGVCGVDCMWGSWTLKLGYQCCAGWTQSCNAGFNCSTQGSQSCDTSSHQWNACMCQ